MKRPEEARRCSGWPISPQPCPADRFSRPLHDPAVHELASSTEKAAISPGETELSPHITVPRRYRINRAIPATYAIHHRDLADSDRTLVEGIAVVTPAQSIGDAIDTHVDPKLIDQAIDTARRRGLIRGETLADIETRARQAQSAS